mmetsp:Transcript_9680/g.10719  ORF Transcript_9680/g.10719 Transcript_9680/m.10719 type:complete len:256 (-) Transcript_9680:32-799(-)
MSTKEEKDESQVAAEESEIKEEKAETPENTSKDTENTQGEKKETAEEEKRRLDELTSHKKLDKGYVYNDSNGKVQGPFMYSQMLDWWHAGYFQSDLKVKRTGEEQMVPISKRPEFQVPAQTSEMGGGGQGYYPAASQARFAPYSGSGVKASDYQPLGTVDYSQAATFDTRTGRFTSTYYANYWESRGLPSDRAGRMMMHYFDHDAWQEQMRERKRVKELYQGKNKRKVTKEMLKHFKKKKAEKKRRRIIQEYLTD